MQRWWLVSGLAMCVACGGNGGSQPVSETVAEPAAETVAEAAMDAEPDSVTEAAQEAGPELPPFEEPVARVRFDLLATPVESPFPYDYYLTPDGILVDGQAHSSILLPIIDTNQAYRQAFKQMNGFSAYPPIALVASVAVDPASLPQTPEDSLAEGACLRLYQLDQDGLPGTRVAFAAAYRAMPNNQETLHVVSAVPYKPVEPGARFLFVVTDGLRAEDGAPLGRSRGFAQVMGQAAVPQEDPQRAALVAVEQARLAPLVSSLPDAAQVVAAVDFTVGTQQQDTAEILNYFKKNGKYTSVDYTRDGDQDGQDDVTFGGEFPDCSMDAGTMGYGVHGRFHPVNFTGPDASFHRTEQGWTTYEPEEVEYWLMVPPGAGPFPVVISIHGIDASHGQMCGLAREMVKAGLAVMRFDLPRHGERGKGGLDFLDVTNPIKIRDNFRQGACDIASTVLLVEALARDLDLLPAGAPDGQGELDATRIGIQGMSLGAIIAYLYLPFSDRVRVMDGAVGGSGLWHMVEVALVEKLHMGLGGLVGFIYGAEHLLWTGDGVTFAAGLLGEPGTATERFVLAQEVIGDGTVPNSSTEVQVRTAGIPLLKPVAVPIALVPEVDPAAARSGLLQYTGTIHGFFTSGQTPERDLAWKQALTFFTSFFADGVPTVVVE